MISLGSHISFTKDVLDLRDIFYSKGANKCELWLRNNVEYQGGGEAVAGVDRWNDVSANDNHAVQESEDARADIDETNGGYHLDGSAHFFDLTSKIEFAATSQFTIAVVMKLDGNSNEVFLSDSTNEFMEVQTNTKIRIKTTGTGSGNITSVFTADSATWTTGEAFLLTITRATDGTLNIYKNGTLVAGSWSNQTNAGAVDIFNVGCRNDADRFFDGKIYEVLIGSMLLPQTGLKMLHEYYIKVWGLASV